MMCACSGPLTASSHQETQCAVETVQHVAEERHQAVVYNVTTTAEEHHRSKVAQLLGETKKAFEEQARGHAEATDVLKQEAVASREEIVNYLSANQAAEDRDARDAVAEMKRRDSLREEEVGRLMHALQSAQAAIAQS
jgi:hypothetical protein